MLIKNAFINDIYFNKGLTSLQSPAFNGVFLTNLACIDPFTHIMNYQLIYNQIIERGKTRIPKEDEYYEKHHITPKCLGGGNEKENLIKLTAREHFLCHWLLIYIYPENYELGYAFWFMCHAKDKDEYIYKYSSRTYEEARISFSKNIKNDKERNLKISQTYWNKSEEERKEKYIKISFNFKLKSQKERDLINSNKSQSHKRRTKEKELERVNNIINTWDNKSEKEKQEFSKKLSDAHKIPIYQYDLNWNFIKEWPSQKEIELELHIQISSYLKIKNINNSGSFWEYKNNSKTEEQKQEELKNYNNYINSYSILQFDFDWNFIKEWFSIKEINKILHCDVGSYLAGRTKFAGNSFWKRRKDCTKEELIKYNLL